VGVARVPCKCRCWYFYLFTKSLRVLSIQLMERFYDPLAGEIYVRLLFTPYSHRLNQVRISWTANSSRS
jgi:hypothetical protein